MRFEPKTFQYLSSQENTMTTVCERISVIHIRFCAPWALVLLTGCATGYHDLTNPLLGLTGGYWEQNGPGELIKVGFAGNGFISREKVGTYLLYRCAEIAKREGKPYFALYQNLPSAVLDRRSSEKAVTTITGKASDYAYILLFDTNASGLLVTSEVIARLEPEVTAGDKK
jgi:hypothetical protein